MKQDPWSKLRGTRSADQKEFMQYQQENSAVDAAPRSRGYGRTRENQNVSFWSTEIRVTEPIKVRLVPGAYTIPQHVEEETQGAYVAGTSIPNFIWMRHTHLFGNNDKRDVWDTRDVEEGRDLSIHLVENKQADVRSQVMNVYNVVDYGTWHHVPNKKAQGYVDWERCKKDGCPSCEKGFPKHVGRAGYMILGEGYERDLRAIGNYLSKFCVCGCATQLQAYSLSCSACNHELYQATFDENGRVTKPITKAIAYGLYDTHPECPACQKKLRFIPANDTEATIEENLVCERCDSPKRATIYDADLALTRGKKGKEGYFSLLLQENAFQGAGFLMRPPSQTLLDLAVNYDFVKDFGINLKIVAKRLGLPNEMNPYYQAGKGYAERS